jgi:phenylalanyl-tRNA synthetase alpha chain
MPPTDTQPLNQQLLALQQQAQDHLATCHTLPELDAFRVEYLGKKGAITALMKGLKDVPGPDRPALGALANTVNDALSQALQAKQATLQAAALNAKLATETIDVTMPGVALPVGQFHPLTSITNHISHIFAGLGFTVLDDDQCPEVETEYYNFDALNFPADHPARDTQDTFYTNVGSNVVLRSQTSNAQIRFMEGKQPPIHIVAPGRVYRNEEVNSRKNVLFHQLEGLWVDEGVRFSDLKGTLEHFIHHFFGASVSMRLRNSFFPFTEPSVEVDIECLFCHGKGCRTCGGHGWLEVLGAGMVDPNVLQAVGIDSERYTGFAFGLGIERLAMLKLGIDDIRMFYANDLRILQQV